MINVWEQFAEDQIVSPVKARMRAAEKRRQKKLNERDQLFKMWQRWHKERKTELLAGPHKEAAQELADYLERMTLSEGAPALLTLVANARWYDSSEDVKFQVLQLIDHAIIAMREYANLSPFDDSLPFSDEAPNVFLIIREMLNSRDVLPDHCAIAGGE